MKTKSAPAAHVSPVMAPAIPSKESKDVVIGFRVPARWKTNMDKQLNILHVPENRRADFYRGAVLAGIGNALRAQDPNWQKFVEAIQPMAREMLGMELTDTGVVSILEEGEALPSTRL